MACLRQILLTSNRRLCSSRYGSTQGETYYYEKTDYEPSPLNRPLKTYAPGNNWVGANRGVEVKYWMNTAADAVRIWNVGPVSNGFGTYTTAGSYPASMLYKNVTVNEHGKQVIEFKDKTGNVILKRVQLTGNADNGTGNAPSGDRDSDGWLCTYYIYDEGNNLRCVIQPEGVKALAANNWVIDYSPGKLADEQCFRYEYDKRNRMIRKKVPGAGAVYMVYDGRDRLVMTQDANLRNADKWLVTKYDNLNRPVGTGRWDNNGTSFDTHLSNAYNMVTEYPVTSSGYETLTLAHYDDYANLPGALSDYLTTWSTYFSATNNSAWPYPQMPQKSLAIKGLVSWQQTKILGTSDYLYSVNYYDDKGRVIQVQSSNITGGLDVVSTQYNWSGQPLVIVQKQQVATGTAEATVVVTQMTYDDLGRVAKMEKKASNSLVNNGAMPADFTTIAQNRYDRLGQLVNKKLGANNLETLTYEYNIRGWMLEMNRNYLQETNPSNNFFGFELGYDKLTNKTGWNFLAGANNGEFNGNINGMIWKSKGDQVRRKYDFEYDAANRLLKGDFEQNDNGDTWGKSIVDYTVKMGDGSNVNTAYDNNGNIKRMQQWGYKIGGSSQIDPNETVAHVNGNIQKKGPGIVLKVMAGDTVDIGVRTLYHNNPGTQPNANLFNDILASLAGGIVSTAGVAKGTLADLSDPVNSPLKGALTAFRQNNNQDLPSKPKAYLNWILVDEQFKYVSTFPQSGAMPVGTAETVTPLGQSGINITKNGYLYIYVSNETENWDVFFDDLAVTHYTGPLLEETHYYPFGLTMAGISSKAIDGLGNKYEFNAGSELQSKEFSDGSGLEMYDAKFRLYDAQTGRFHQIDPLADMTLNLTAYAFSNNDPILLNDPLGLKGDTAVLPSVTVVGYIKGKASEFSNWFTGKSMNYQGSGWGHGPRRTLANAFGLGNKANNLIELGMHSQLQSSQVNLTGGLLDKIKADPAMVAFQKKIIAFVKSDPRFKKIDFKLSNRQVVGFGGDRWVSKDEDWGAVNGNNPAFHAETWQVAGNELTWALRNATVEYTATVKSDGTAVISYHVTSLI